MVKAYLPKTYLSLTTIGALDEKYLNLMFVDFFVEILPENLVLRIVDAYLLEGVKVLYRFGLGLIKGYKHTYSCCSSSGRSSSSGSSRSSSG
jgi:hypothetical protein